MSDPIERQAAIDALDNIIIPRNASWYPYYQQALTAMGRLPSAYPELCEDAVSRADVVDMLEMYPFTEYSEYEAAREVVKRLPPVTPKTEQPEIIRCRQCKQFRRWIDTDFHFCDRTEVEVSLDDFCSRAERREE